MKLIDLLNAVVEFDGELITEKYETNYSFCWGKDTTITELGKLEFKKILNSNVMLDFVERNRNIILLDKSITYEELERFTGAVAGYVSVKSYKKWFKWEEENATDTN